MRLLVVEDSEVLANALQRQFASDGYACDCAADGESALGFLREYDYDAVVLDLMLPRLGGLELLKRYREAGGNAPILVLSARNQVDDRVLALDAGADDYLIKPFNLDELRARVRALMRRPAQSLSPVIRCGPVEVDTRTHVVRSKGGQLNLTPKEYALIEFLARHQGRVVSRSRIFEHLYDSRSDASDKVVEVIVSTLRAKLGQAGAADLIQTRRGFGYIVS